MQINVSGVKSKKRIAEIEEAASFFASLLMDPRMVRNIELDIEISKSLDVQGACNPEDDGRRPRWFTIQLRDAKGDDPLMKTLAHEMVHIKQFAKGEMYTDHFKTARGYRKLQTEWQGSVWNPSKKEHEYFDSPWEIEAYGREVGLYQRYIEMMNKKVKKNA